MFKVIALTVIATPLLAVGYVHWLGSMYGDAYALVPIGATELDVRELAGDPSYVTDGTRWVEPKYAKTEDQIVPGCVKELWYAMPWPLPQRFSFCFDRNGILLDRYHWVSW